MHSRQPRWRSAPIKATVAGLVGGIALLALVGCGGSQTTGASPAGPIAQAPSPTATAAPLAAAPAASAQPGRQRPAFSGTPGAGGGAGFLFGNSQVLSQALHLTPEQVQSQLQSGKSIEQIAQAQNVPLQQVGDAIAAAQKSRLDQAVSSGRMTSDQETQALQTFQARLPQLLAATPGPNAGQRGPRARGTPPTQ